MVPPLDLSEGCRLVGGGGRRGKGKKKFSFVCLVVCFVCIFKFILYFNLLCICVFLEKDI